MIGIPVGPLARLFLRMWFAPMFGMSFFGLGMGPSGDEKRAYNNTVSISGWAANEGENDVSAADAFERGILSGNSSQITQSLAPQIGGAKERESQQAKTMSQFGARSGGTAAGMFALDDSTHAMITDLIGSLTSGAASSLGSRGTALAGMGLQGFGQAFNQANTMHDQSAAQMGDIFSSAAKVVTGVVGGIGNLDTTGSSSFGEQVGNFFGGWS